MDGERGVVRLIVALHGGFIGHTPVDRALLRHITAVHRLAQKPLGSALVALLRQQAIARLACRIRGTRAILPSACDLDGGLVHPPAAPHQALAPGSTPPPSEQVYRPLASNEQGDRTLMSSEGTPQAMQVASAVRKCTRQPASVL